MIAYLDTSALVPLLVEEPASPLCRQVWDDADDVVSVRIAYVESAAALARARRLKRLSRRAQVEALDRLEDTWSQMQIVEIDQSLVNRAGILADARRLRGYDATHCAAAESIKDANVVTASGDGQLLTAWRALGLNTLDVNAAVHGG